MIGSDLLISPAVKPKVNYSDLAIPINVTFYSLLNDSEVLFANSSRF